MSRKSIVFIDARVSNFQSLADSFGSDSEVFVLDGQSDGLTQMASALQGWSGVAAIHVISHGSAGALYLGSTLLSSANLADYRVQLAGIGSSLMPSGDILLYGCNVAQGDAGLQFITALAQMTGADVAASDDATGAAALGGDGVLERATGQVAAPALAVEGWAQTLAVNTLPTFTAQTGKLTTDFGSRDEGYSITLQTDGKILVAGSGGSDSGGDFALARYNADGSLDTSFDGDGKLTTDFGSYDRGQSITLQPDGKILVAGIARNSSSGDDFAIARYNADGSLDTSFDGDGKLTTDFGEDNRGYSITLQPDGKILVAGSSGWFGGGDFALARYNADGSLDTSFDGDGKLTTDLRSGNSITLQPDGKILVAGDAYNGNDNNFALARYNADGGLDPSFDGDGKLTTDFFGSSDYGNSITLQTDGKILVAGSAYNSIGGSSDFALARYNANGSLDTSFDGDGKLTTDFGSYDDYGQSITLQPDGKILVAGSTFRNSGNFAMARYNANGSLDTSFDGDGKLTTDFRSDDRGYSITLQPNGKILVAGSSGIYSGDSSDFALAAAWTQALARWSTP